MLPRNDSPKIDRKQFREISANDVPSGRSAKRAHRSARFPAFIGMDPAVIERLGQLVVLIVAAGSVGRYIAMHFARLQVAEIWIVDHASYKAESLLTQPITPDDVGQPKATNTGLLVKQISPGTRVFVYDGPVQDLGVEPFQRAGPSPARSYRPGLLSRVFPVGNRAETGSTPGYRQDPGSSGNAKIKG